MDQIKGGASGLKHHEASSQPAKPASGGFLAEIAAGRKLRKTSDLPPIEEPAPELDGMQAALAKSMARYRKFVAPTNYHDDDSEDEDW